MDELDDFITKYRSLSEIGRDKFVKICQDFGIQKDRNYTMEMEVEKRGGWLRLVVQAKDLIEFTIRFDVETKEFVVHFNGHEARNVDFDDAAYSAYEKWKFSV